MIEYIKIEGYKSIKKMELELRPINILIGGNGSGKSNFISFFKLLAAVFNNRLQQFVAQEKADRILYFGRKQTDKMNAKISFSHDRYDNHTYRFGLSTTRDESLLLSYETSTFNAKKDDSDQTFYHVYLRESKFISGNEEENTLLQRYASEIKVYHFHDTSDTSYLRRACDLNDNLFLRQDGRNLPAFLYYLKIKQPFSFNFIVKIIQSVAPYIDRFILEPSRLNERDIELHWVDTGDADSNFSAYELSDGTLRFIALATLLLQPRPPKVIIIDEPELGLHPFAISKLAGLIQSASAKAQIIIATQSSGLISNFIPEDIIIIDKSKEENQTVFKRLSSEDLDIWLQDYSLGDLWERNIINAAQPFIQ